MSHRSKLYGMYEEEGELEAIMGMSKADKMFEDLGYTKTLDDKQHVIYKKFFAKGIYSRISFAKIQEFVLADDGDEEKIGLDIYELQAINEKAKELGWLDEKST